MGAYSIIGEFLVGVTELDSKANKPILLAIIKATSVCRVAVNDATAVLFWLNQLQAALAISPITCPISKLLI